jgi:GET complex subunit GET2
MVDPHRFMQALIGGGPNLGDGRPSPFATGATDPFDAILSSLGSSGMTSDGSKLSPTTSTSPLEPTPLPPRSLPFMPFFRFLSTIAMVIFFVFYLEPFNFARMEYYGLETPSRWGRWADLTRRETGEWGVQPVVGLCLYMLTMPWSNPLGKPIFWEFISLQLAVHSFQLFYGNQPSPLPMFVAMVLPHFPHPLPTIVTNAFHYIHMTQMLLDDMAVWVVTVGFIIWVAGWGN